MSSFPYRVKVKSTGRDLHVSVSPQPVVIDEKYQQVVTKSFSSVLMKKRTGFFAKSQLKADMMQELKKFHDLGIIKPKEDTDNA